MAGALTTGQSDGGCGAFPGPMEIRGADRRVAPRTGSLAPEVTTNAVFPLAPCVGSGSRLRKAPRECRPPLCAPASRGVGVGFPSGSMGVFPLGGKLPHLGPV
jgi:hypothetical protein